ncbi:UBN2 domain-containing protein [Gossypium australe]|uniref:UBN2 domain-containing protein n=1 Tax=Gossypium australe TaxID=47621 RepID=A0A5B6V4W2_9ROSI|nr:UBN2 domain-containing protein [Gossypium australe]
MRKIGEAFNSMPMQCHSIFPDEYIRVSSCSNAKEIWDKLEVTHEGTSQVKKFKLEILTLNYKTFNMKPEEDINEMSDRFTIIINGLKSYGKTYPNEEVVRKMLRNLLTSWEAKVTAIEEVKNLENLTLDELIGSLLTHEMRLNKGVEEEKVMKKNVGITLKTTTNENSESSKDVNEDEEMEMFTGRFKRFVQTKHKAYVTAWSDEDSSNNEDQEVVSLCLMVINDSKVTSNSSISNPYSIDK